MTTVTLLLVFFIGYLAIALEHNIRINKAAVALGTGVLCWTLYVTMADQWLTIESIPEWFRAEQGGEASNIARLFAIEFQLLEQTGEIAGILFFLMGAMTIVELVDSQGGFEPITSRIKTRNMRGLVLVVGTLTFFMSAVLDNLTSTIVMVSLLRKLVPNHQQRLALCGFVVISANAGGAWTPIGDVTTTMLWIKHKIGAVEVMRELLVPSVVCLIVPLLGMMWRLHGKLEGKGKDSIPATNLSNQPHTERHKWLFLTLGVSGLVSVPVFKSLTHLPPFMGMLLSLAVLWIVSECVDSKADDHATSETGVLAALKRIDMSSILFFLGILLSVGALGATGTLHRAALWLDATMPNREFVAILIGLVSAVVDNVPLVAAGIEMYDLPLNNSFWMLLAYTAGTGGSCLIIGSAAGVAVMGMERVSFFWYVKHISGWALLGYLAGASVLIATQSIP